MQRAVQEEFQKQIFEELKKLEERLSETEMELLGKNHSLEQLKTTGGMPTWEEGREKLAAEGEVTRTAGGGSQTSDVEAESSPRAFKQMVGL